MGTTTISSRQFNQDTSGAKRAAANGPVVITDRGHPSYVLLSMEAYRELTGKPMSLFDAIAPSEPHDFDFDPPQLKSLSLRIPDFE